MNYDYIPYLSNHKVIVEILIVAGYFDSKDEHEPDEAPRL